MSFHVGVATEDSVDATLLGICNRAGGNLRAEPQPSRIDAVQVSGKRLFISFEFLDLVVDQLPNAADENIARKRTIELMAMNRQMPFSAVLPCISLVNGYSDKVRHHFRQSSIVVSLDPDDFDLPLRVRELANVGEKAPVFARKTAEVEIREDVADENQPPE
jgi:hypothetical protein